MEWIISIHNYFSILTMKGEAFPTSNKYINMNCKLFLISRELHRNNFEEFLLDVLGFSNV